MGKSSINGPFSMAMLNNQRVDDSNMNTSNTSNRCQPRINKLWFMEKTRALHK